MSAIRWNTTTPEIATQSIAHRLDELLIKHTSVLWLVSGGSNIAVQKAVLSMLTAPLDGLTIALVDERFGTLGHKDSNWQKLVEADFFRPGPMYVPTLKSETPTLEEATMWWNFTLEKLVSLHEYVYAQLGIGDDGHTAGILPLSSATVSDEYAHGYTADDFKRITATFRAIRSFDEVALVSFSASKHNQLERLKSENIKLAVQPVQVVKDIRTTNVYTDI